MSLHAALEQSDDVTIVWILSERQASAVVHELFEFFGLISAKLFNFGLFLLFLDVSILFGL